MFLSREIDEKNVSTIYENEEMVDLNRSYSAKISSQSENEDNPEKLNCNLGFLQLLFIIFIFIFNRYIDNIIYPY